MFHMMVKTGGSGFQPSENEGQSGIHWHTDEYIPTIATTPKMSKMGPCTQKCKLGLWEGQSMPYFRRKNVHFLPTGLHADQSISPWAGCDGQVLVPGPRLVLVPGKLGIRCFCSGKQR